MNDSEYLKANENISDAQIDTDIRETEMDIAQLKLENAQLFKVYRYKSRPHAMKHRANCSRIEDMEKFINDLKRLQTLRVQARKAL